MSHNSLFLSFRLFVRVLLHGLWQKDTKSAGHSYKVLFLAGRERKTKKLLSFSICKSHTKLSCPPKHFNFPVNDHYDRALSLQLKRYFVIRSVLRLV